MICSPARAFNRRQWLHSLSHSRIASRADTIQKRDDSAASVWFVPPTVVKMLVVLLDDQCCHPIASRKNDRMTGFEVDLGELQSGLSSQNVVFVQRWVQASDFRVGSNWSTHIQKTNLISKRLSLRQLDDGELRVSELFWRYLTRCSMFGCGQTVGDEADDPRSNSHQACPVGKSRRIQAVEHVSLMLEGQMTVDVDVLMHSCEHSRECTMFHFGIYRHSSRSRYEADPRQ